MPVMSKIESAFCRSTIWASFARHVVLPWALEGTQLSGDVLEIGAGSGAMADGMVRAFREARLTVTDIDEAMVSAARARLAGRRNVIVEQADVTGLPFEDSTFDVVTSYLMLHHVVEWRAALTEAGRVLRPGGTLLGYDLAHTPLAGLIHRADRSPHRIVSATELRGGMTDAGLTGITVHPSVGGLLMRFRAVKNSR